MFVARQAFGQGRIIIEFVSEEEKNLDAAGSGVLAPSSKRDGEAG